MLVRKIVVSIATFAAVGLCAFADTVIEPMSTPSWGYTVTGLGNGNEVALVFTNHLDATMTWTVPRELENVRFLVVGGGGGGEEHGYTKGTGGAGGGGGAGNYGYRLVDGYNGGSGIVVIRYRQKPPVFKIIVR